MTLSIFKNNEILFQDNLANALLQIDTNPQQSKSIISESLVRKFTHHNFDEIGYSIAQLLEPGTMVEIGFLTGQKEEDLLTFNYKKSENLEKLMWLLAHEKYLSVFQRINLTYCLISLCRYQKAQEILRNVSYDHVPQHFKFYYLTADFYLSNRFENGARSNQIYDQKRALMEAQPIDPLLILQSCTQAVVWHLKTKEISKDNFEYFKDQGEKIAQEISSSHCLSLSCLSGWYRAIAMVPAFQQDIPLTRHYMDLAHKYADQITPQNRSEELAKMHMLKTYYESESKEFLFVHKDLKAAEISALHMIDQDPYWSISWGELGELYAAQKNYDKALEAFSQAYELGLPRLIRHYFYMGNCHGLMGNNQEALLIFNEILLCDPHNVSAALAGLKYAQKSHLSESAKFSNFLDKHVKEGLISSDKINQLMAA